MIIEILMRLIFSDKISMNVNSESNTLRRIAMYVLI